MTSTAPTGTESSVVAGAVADPLADQHVRDLVSADGLDETLFVEAGAGTGKTSQLVARVVNLVLSAGIRLRDIAAITFTEAAAAELRDRIRVAFEQEAMAAEGERRERCLAAVADSDQAAITTLHGFARRLLAEHPLAVGLPPRVEVADEIESQLAFERRWEQFVDRLHATEAHEPLLERAALTGVELEPRYPNHVTLKDVAAILTQSWDRLEQVAGREVTPLGPPDVAEFDAAVDELAAVPPACCDGTDKLYEHLERVLTEMRAIREIDDPERQLALLTGVTDKTWGRGRGGSKTAWDRPVTEIKDLITAVGEAGASVSRRASGDVLDRLLILIARVVLEAADHRRQEGRLEFHDLLVLARRLLRTSPAARASLHERYRCLLLDEFQDTDPIQIELAVLIAGAVGETPADHWHDVEVGPGRLFFVGDPKQSIYRFRRADIELFLQARGRFGADGGLARLSVNFRTVAPILEWINDLFASLMGNEKAGQQASYEPLISHRHASPDGDHRPVLLGGPHLSGGDRRAYAAELREAEAGDVATVIRHIRDHPERWPVLGADREWRPAQLSDVTVLVPTRISVPYLRAALDDAKLPYRLDTGTLVFDTQEIRDVLSVVRAVDDPSDEVSVVAALRSPLYGCSDVELFTFHQAGGWWDPSKPPPEDLADHQVGRSMAHLHELWRQRWWLRPADLVERILRERHAMLAAFGDDRPREVWRRLRFLLDQARAFDDTIGGGLRAFSEWAELQRSGGSRVHEPLLAETDDDSVRVMTVHGAKGLEFPITILSGMTTKPTGRRQGANVIWDDDEPAIKVGRNVVTDNFDPRAEIEDDMDADEKLRLLYVAGTRARDHLIVSCHHKVSQPAGKDAKGDNSYGHQIWDVMTGDDRATGRWRSLADVTTPTSSEASGQLQLWDDPGAGPSLGPEDDADREGDRERWVEQRAAVLASARRPSAVSATSIAAAASADAIDGEPTVADALAGRLPDVTGPGDAAVDDDSGARRWRRGRAATAIGRAVHATLQSVRLDADPAGQPIEQIAAREARVEAVPDAGDQVAALVRGALESDAVALARVHPHHQELFVAAPVGDRVIEGFVDLLIETPEGLVVVDYKTDAASSGAEIDTAVARYELQAAAYAVALERSTGMSVQECRLVFCGTRGTTERSLDDLDGRRQRIVEARDVIR